MTSDKNHLDGDALWEALARYAAGESPDAERERVAQWLDAHPAEQRLVAALRNKAGQGDGIDSAAVEAALRKLQGSGDG